MPADSSQRRVVVFTGKYLSLSTVETVEAVAQTFPHWHITVLQENQPRRWGRYLRGKVRRLRREPVSYPLEILFELAGKLRWRSSRKITGKVALPSGPDQLSCSNVQYRECDSLHQADVVGFVESLQPWLGIAISAPVLKPCLFTIPQRGTINLHKSLLPNYRGMPPGFWELHDGVAETGVSVHWVDESLDAGNVIRQQSLQIPPYSTLRGLAAQLDLAGQKVLLDVLGSIEDGSDISTPQPQPVTPTNRRPPWLVRRRIEKDLASRRRLNRGLLGWVRELGKRLVLAAYVYLWAFVRNWFRGWSGRCHATVLLYHRVNDQLLDSVTVGIEQFKHQLNIIKRRYDVLDMPTFLAGKGRPRKRPCVVLTFDDGYEDNFLASMLLRRDGLPCTFFLSTRVVGSHRAFEHDLKKLGERVPTLSWDQVRQMGKWAFDFGNHAADHANLGQLPLEEALAQIKTANSDLDDELGQSKAEHWLAFPFGRQSDITKEVWNSLPSVRISHCFSAYGGVNPPNFDNLNILRQAVDHNFSDLAFRAALEGWCFRYS